MEMEKFVNSQKNELHNMLKSAKRKLALLPPERVGIRNRHNTYSLAIYSGGKKYNTKRKEQYKSLSDSDSRKYATKLYLEHLVPLLEEELAALTYFQQNYKPALKYEVLPAFPPKVRALVNTPLLSPAEFSKAWADAPYPSNSMPFDERNSYCSQKGDRVRSRAELFIADTLYQAGIPYRYEMAYTHNGNTHYPDFTLMHPFTGELFYLEYFGLMDDDDYRQKALAKIRDYYKTPDAGNFIFLFESQLISMDTTSIQNAIFSRMGLDAIDSPLKA